jgi:hypothetical protein
MIFDTMDGLVKNYMHSEWQLISNKDFPYNDFIPYKVGRAI